MKKRTLFFSLLIVSMLLVGCLGGGGSKPDRSATLEGTIYDDRTKEIISADIFLRLGSKDQMTSYGLYYFSDLIVGPKNFYVSAHGYEPHEEFINIKVGKNTRDIYLTPDSENGDDDNGNDPDNDDDKLNALVTSIRNAGISITETWKPQIEGMEKRITDDIIPFQEEVGDLLCLVLNAFYKEGDITELEEDGRIGFTFTYTYDEDYTVIMESDSLDFDNAYELGEQIIFDASITLLDPSKIELMQGTALVEAEIDDIENLKEWLEAFENDRHSYHADETEWPTKLFFTVAELELNAWCKTDNFDDVNIDAVASFNKDNLKLEYNGSFESHFISFEGNGSVKFTDEWKVSGGFLPFMLESLDFNGLIIVPELAKVEGSLEINFVENRILDTFYPREAKVWGQYTDLLGEDEVILACGVYQLDWENASSLTEENAELGYKITFDGYTQEPSRPEIGLTLEAEFNRSDEIIINIEYGFGTHSLAGCAVIKDLEGAERASIEITLTNEHGLQITLTNDTEWEDDKMKIGKISNEEGKLLAEIYLIEGVPHVFTEDGEYQSLLS